MTVTNLIGRMPEALLSRNDVLYFMALDTLFLAIFPFMLAQFVPERFIYRKKVLAVYAVIIGLLLIYFNPMILPVGHLQSAEKIFNDLNHFLLVLSVVTGILVRTLTIFLQKRGWKIFSRVFVMMVSFALMILIFSLNRTG